VTLNVSLVWLNWVSVWLDLIFKFFLLGLFSAGVMFGNFIHGTKSILWVLCFQNDFGVVFLSCLFPLFFLVLSHSSQLAFVTNQPTKPVQAASRDSC
jgi:hypothetical protein